jgi:AraC-like DNA-binding protein
VIYYFSKNDIFHSPELPVDVFRVLHDESMPMHRHEFSELVIVTRGEALHINNTHEHLIMMGDVFVVHPSGSHGYENVKKLELINILFSQDLLTLPRTYRTADGSEEWKSVMPGTGEQDSSDPNLLYLKLDTDRLVEVNELIRELEEAAALRGAGSMCLVTSSFLKIIGTLLGWYSDIRKQRPRLDYQVSRAFSFIADNYTQPVSLTDLTDTAGMSKSSLTRAFRKSAGLTPIEYVISYRIRQSCRLLQYTDKNVTEIAFASGFSDSNYFTRKFHDLMELTPLEFRRQSRKKEPPFDATLPQPSESSLSGGSPN